MANSRSSSAPFFSVGTVDYSFISYPLSIRLFGLKDDERAALLGKTAVLAVALSLVLVVAMALGTMLLGGLAILLPVCLCYLCWQAQETLRRFVLADFRYRAAVAGDAVAYVGQGLLVAILLYFDSVTLPLALYAMSATFAAGALVHASKLRFAWPDLGDEARIAGIGARLHLRRQMVRRQLSARACSRATSSLDAGGRRGYRRNGVVSGCAEHRQHDEPDYPRDRQRHSADRCSSAPVWRCHRRVAGG